MKRKVRKMKKIYFMIIGSLLFLAGPAFSEKAPECIKDGVKYGVTRGSFRAEWWNYQERGMSYIDGECYEYGLRDIEEAIKLRSALVKKDCDQRRARTYGMHFVDYFGHRERGVALYHLGQLDEAEKELEFSLSCVESNKAQYYLDLVRKKKLEMSQADKEAPDLEITEPRDKSYLKQSEIQIKGRAWDDSFVKEVWLGENPLAIPVSEKQIVFQQAVELEPGWNSFKVKAVDIMGKERVRDFSVYLDQQGPELTFFEINQIAGAEIEAVGEASDDSGVVKLILNNKDVSLEGGKSFRVRLNVAQDWRIWFKAIDKAGNETEGVINLTSEPKGARRESLFPAQYASLESDWDVYPTIAYQPLSFALNQIAEENAKVALTEYYWNLKEKYETYMDSEAPVIKLRGFRGEQTVYFPEIYLEGVVSDQSPIAELSINGKKIGKAQAKNLFFNQIIPLSVGANTITIRAVDVKGNTSEKILRIYRVTPTVVDIKERMVVSMLPFYQSGQIQEIGEVAYDNLISAIVSQKRFNFVDRAKVEAIVRELKLSAEQLVDPNYTLKVGKMTASEAMIIGYVKEAPNSIEIYSQLVDVESGMILAEKDAYNQDKSLASLKYLTRGLAIRLREDFPVLQGRVVKLDGKNIVLDIGASQKMKPGMRVIVFEEKEIRDVETGISLGYATDKLGVGKITSVYDRMSNAEVIGKTAELSADKKVITK